MLSQRPSARHPSGSHSVTRKRSPTSKGTWCLCLEDLGATRRSVMGRFKDKVIFVCRCLDSIFSPITQHSRRRPLPEEGRRLNVNDPENSLIVLKPTEQTDHEGGKRFEEDSWEHHLLLCWIESGAKGTSPAATSRTRKSKFTPDEVSFFKQSVQPILENHCYECHGFNSRKGGLALSTRESSLAGGDSGPAVSPASQKRVY